MSEWKICTIGDVITLKRGYDLPTKIRKEGMYPVVSASGVSDTHNQFKVKGPGVTTGRSGTIGKSFYIKEDYWPLNTSLYVQDFKGNDPRYVSYLLENLRLDRYNAGSGVPTLNRNHIHPIKIKIPHLKLQKKISTILGNLEDKIELNKSSNRTLEEMAMTLYKHWFVDFSPFHENDLMESELGMIPKGWQVHSIYDLADYTNGKAFKTKDLYEVGKLPVIKIAELKSGLSVNTKFYNGEYREKHEINNGDVLFAWSASLGVYLWGKGKALLNQHIFNVKPKDSSIIRKSFMYFMLRRLIDKFVNIAASRATTMGHITKNHLRDEKIALPSEKELEEIQDKLDYYYQLILLNTMENESLIQTRDYLLPKLLSGEIEVSKIKEKVKESI